MDVELCLCDRLDAALSATGQTTLYADPVVAASLAASLGPHASSVLDGPGAGPWREIVFGSTAAPDFGRSDDLLDVMQRISAQPLFAILKSRQIGYVVFRFAARGAGLPPDHEQCLAITFSLLCPRVSAVKTVT